MKEWNECTALKIEEKDRSCELMNADDGTDYTVAGA